MVDKRTVIWVALLALLFFFWVPIMIKLGLMQPLPPRSQPTPVSTADTTGVAKKQPLVDSTALPSSVISDLTSLKTAAILQNQDIPEDTIIIETKVWTIILSNYGGGPVSLKLHEYKYHTGELIEMLPECRRATPELIFLGGTLNANNLVYNSSLTKGKYSATTSPLELTYTYRNEKGAALSKRYRFYPDRYDYDLIVDIDNRGSLGFEREYSLEWNNRLDPTERDIASDYNAMWAMAYQGKERIKFTDYTNNKYDVALSGNTDWIAMRSKYFAAALIPRSKPAVAAKSSGVKENVAMAGGTILTHKVTIGLTIELPNTDKVTDSFTVLAGPIDYENLKSYNNTMADLVDIGTTPFVGWIIKLFAVPTIWLMPRMYSIIPNYGAVIIIFSLMVKLLTWPLSKKTVRSMLAMREIQPKMEELKKKHKNNPQALNKEMMKLYKEAGINPFSGCLPYLPQLPLFLALYAVFSSTIVLRQAPFILWWDDLSRGALSLTDPYITMVILMMALMFIQQKMTMTDPKNKMLIYIMPLIMGFAFYKASAGLVLYWTCFSLFSFVEQLVIKPQRSITGVPNEIK